MPIAFLLGKNTLNTAVYYNIDRQLGMLKLIEFYFGTCWLYKHISVDNGQLTEDS